jgi:glutathione synthase/RimK-type ligase-like ATP-grasp enzyme
LLPGSSSTPERYAGRDGAVTHSWTPDDDVAERCLLLAADLGLDFAAIDLRITPDGEAVCFEVDPSPAYSAFEQATGPPIARYLAGV